MAEPTIKPADPVHDLKEAAPAIRFAAAAAVSAAGSYFLRFGIVAALGTWRASLFSPAQMGLVGGALLLQTGIGWLLRLSPIATAAVFGVLWTVPNALLQAMAASPNDFPDVVYALLLPPVASLANGAFFGMLCRSLEIEPMRPRRRA